MLIDAIIATCIVGFAFGFSYRSNPITARFKQIMYSKNLEGMNFDQKINLFLISSNVYLYRNILIGLISIVFNFKLILLLCIGSLLAIHIKHLRTFKDYYGAILRSNEKYKKLLKLLLEEKERQNER